MRVLSSPTPPSSPSLSSCVSPLAPGAVPIANLLSGLRSIPDSRAQGQVLHPLGDVLLTALFATIADCDDFISMGIFAQTQLDWLRQYVPLIHGAPSHDTFRNVFMMIKPAALLEITSAWVGSLEGLHVRIDGPAVAGSTVASRTPRVGAAACIYCGPG